jgi:serine/threonine protein phosphatase PrpC
MDTFAFAETHIGQRAQNEDWYGVSEDVGLFVVADGMGGYRGGEVASRIAVSAVDGFYRDLARRPFEEFDDGLLKRSRMDAAFRLANLEVRRHRRGVLAKMGSTLSALIVRGRRALIGHVGDSRVYRFRQGQLERLTADHSLVAAMQHAGVSKMMVSRLGHIITRAIGINDTTLPDVLSEEVEHGDKFLLCTDGLTDMVSDDRISEMILDVPVADVCSELVREALRRGGDDNITALFVEAVDVFPEQTSVAAAL